ncbi:hypothetical protein C4J65_01475 [Streptomyces sp. CB09001]|nr:hypothetical protein C4J65_01475 [Streptomyces sp. CB09001]
MISHVASWLLADAADRTTLGGEVSQAFGGLHRSRAPTRPATPPPWTWRARRWPTPRCVGDGGGLGRPASRRTGGSWKSYPRPRRLPRHARGGALR